MQNHEEQSISSLYFRLLRVKHQWVDARGAESARAVERQSRKRQQQASCLHSGLRHLLQFCQS